MKTLRQFIEEGRRALPPFMKNKGWNRSGPYKQAKVAVDKDTEFDPKYPDGSHSRKARKATDRDIDQGIMKNLGYWRWRDGERD